jgi:hypothetical protein
VQSSFGIAYFRVTEVTEIVADISVFLIGDKKREAMFGEWFSSGRGDELWRDANREWLFA